MPVLKEKKNFEVGSYVFTTKPIEIWGDYLLQRPINPNSRGQIKAIVKAEDDVDSTVYEVFFHKELPVFKIKHSNLR